MTACYQTNLSCKNELHQYSLNWDFEEREPSPWLIVDFWSIEDWWGLENSLMLREDWEVIDRSLVEHWFYSMFSLAPTSTIAPKLTARWSSSWLCPRARTVFWTGGRDRGGWLQARDLLGGWREEGTKECRCFSLSRRLILSPWQQRQTVLRLFVLRY